MTRKTKDRIRKLVYRFIKLYNSYSQAGEDSILTFLFASFKIENPSYVDVGANRPDSNSNTYIFYLRGSRGVCIEPDKNLFENFVKRRPLDKCLNVAVGAGDIKEMDLFIFDDPAANTLSIKDAQERIDGGDFKHLDTKKVAVKRLEDIIKENCSELPHFISLDIEGFDYEVLKAFDFGTYPVPVWIVETINYSPNPQKTKNNFLIGLMQSKNYFVYADTYINTIFVLKEWFENYEVKKNTTV